MPLLISVSRLAITLCLGFAVWSCSIQAARGDIRLNKLFSDHMVLQQQSNVKIWGTAAPNEKLIVKFDNQTQQVTADENGDWSSFVKTPQAGGPYEIEVSAESGTPRLLISDVMIGEVWICAGQLNMESPISNALNPETEIEQSKKYPNIRLFKADPNPSPKSLQEFSKVTPWEVCSPESVKEFSAVSYFFGRELNKKLDVPIGLIQTTWGGVKGGECEVWTNRTAMDASAELAPLLRRWDEINNPTELHRPGNLFNGMVAPLKGFSFQGVIWYQGEGNVDRGQQYATLFPLMIDCWRKELAEGASSKLFPFYFVQLAPYRYKGSQPTALPELWEAQFKTAQSVPNTGMAVTTDIGDINEIRPKNKQEVGRRLSLWALAKTYSAQIDKNEQIEVCCGPTYESMAILDNKIRIAFKPESGKLQSRDDEKLTCFSICGEDGKFYPADAWVDGQGVIVTSAEVAKPVAVRFAWDDSSQPNFFNTDRLPASPFRTDNFDLSSKDRDF